MKPVIPFTLTAIKVILVTFVWVAMLTATNKSYGQNFNHPLSGNQEVMLSEGTYNYYDSGGPNGNYANNTNSSILFIPEEGYYLRWRVLSYAIEDNSSVCGGECCDQLTAGFLPNCGDLFFNTIICGTGGAGDFNTLCKGESIAFNFFSNNSVTLAGWHTIISVQPKDPFYMECTSYNCLDVSTLSCDGSVGGQSGDTDTRTADIEEFYCFGFGQCVGSVDYYPDCDNGYYPGPERVYTFAPNEEVDLIFSCECITDVFLVHTSSCEVSYCWKADFIGGQFILPNVTPGYYTLYAEYDCEGNDDCFCDLEFICLDPGTAGQCPESCCPSFISDFSKCADFENYTTGNIVPQGTPPFELFGGLQSQQAVVSTLQKVSGTKSLRFTASSDINFVINRTINYPARLEWMTYIPNGKTGAFGFYTFNSQVYPIHVNYVNGIATVYTQSSPGNSQPVGSFSYTANTWFKTVIIFLPGEGKIEYWQNGVLRYTHTNFTISQVGKLNLYRVNGGNSEFFIDDICYKEKHFWPPICSEEYIPVCVNGVSYHNGCYAAEAGYSECEWTEGACENDSCSDCDKCFLFVPRYQTVNIVDFQNRYCFDFIPQLQSPDERSVVTTYQWSVLNATEQYVNGTSAASQHPSIQFPGAGTYTVCQQVFENGTLVFECCRTVFVGACNTPPVAFFTAQEVLFGRFQLNTNANGNHVQWRLLDPNAFFFQGTENSTNPVVVLPGGGCTTICLYVTNACGTSMYCIEICVNDPNCSGTLPPVWITNAIVPIIEDNTVQIDLPNPPGGGTATYLWNLGDGETATTQDIFYTYPDEGNFEVCVTMTLGCRTWCYCWIVPISPCTPVYTVNGGDLTVQFTGSETNLQYTITSVVPKAAGESWTVNDQPVNGSSTSLAYTFPTAGNYRVCFPYLGNDGCVHYYCIDIGVGNPFACTNITWQFAASTGYQFSIPAGATQISWTIDETGQQIGTGLASNWVLPVAPCGFRTISVRYFDGVRYRICCLRIYLCPPDECATSIDYGYLASTDQATFRLNASGATDITWFFDDTPSQTLGTTINLVIPYPGTCVSRWISVRYKDSSGRWRICCRRIYFCNPVACSSIRVNYVPGSGYSFKVDQPQTSMSWVVEETGASLGTNQTSAFLPTGPTCDYRTVSLRYWDPILGWRLCCVRFYWCDPVACGDIITYSVSGNSLVLHAPDNLQQVRWYENTTLLGSANPQPTTLSSLTNHTICLSYFDPCDNSWKWCCSAYAPGGSSGALTFDFADAICGDQDDLVNIPLRVTGFTNMINFQLSVQVDDTTKGKLVSLVPQNIPGDFESAIINARIGAVYWESSSAVSLADHSIIAVARVRIVSTDAGETKLRITGIPTPIYAEDGMGNEIIPVVRDGSFCYENLVSICGKVTREDLFPIANVNMTINGCQQFHTVTDANGNYCFMDVPAGKTYQVAASKNTNHKNGVNSGDLTAIKRHILNILKLNSPYKIAAADAKKSNAVNTGDVSELRRLILGALTTLPTCESWEFTDKKYVYPVPTDPFSTGWPTAIELPNVQEDISNADMIGWKMGDVNNSNNPLNVIEDFIDTRSLTDIYFFASSEQVQGFDTFWVDITTRQFTDISNGQFSLRYDPATFELHDTDRYHPALDLSGDNFHIEQTNGSLGFVWDAIDAVTVPDDAILFSLKFTSKVLQFATSEVNFSQDPVSYYFENVDGEELNVITSDGVLMVPVRDIDTQRLVVVPNPNTGKFYIHGLDGSVDRVEVLDARGIKVIEKRDMGIGEKISLELSQVGVYVVKVWQGEKVYFGRVVIIR